MSSSIESVGSSPRSSRSSLASSRGPIARLLRGRSGKGHRQHRSLQIEQLESRQMMTDGLLYTTGLVDDFDANGLNGETWTIGYKAGRANGVTSVDNGDLIFDGNAITTTQEFDPREGKGIRVRGSFTNMPNHFGGYDALFLSTRSDGSVDSSTSHGRTNNGIEFVIQDASNEDAPSIMQINRRQNGVVETLVSRNLAPDQFQFNSTADFEITDDGSTVSFTAFGTTLTATVDTAFPVNKVTMTNPGPSSSGNTMNGRLHNIQIDRISFGDSTTSQGTSEQVQESQIQVDPLEASLVMIADIDTLQREVHSLSSDVAAVSIDDPITLLQKALEDTPLHALLTPPTGAAETVAHTQHWRRASNVIIDGSTLTATAAKQWEIHTVTDEMIPANGLFTATIPAHPISTHLIGLSLPTAEQYPSYQGSFFQLLVQANGELRTFERGGRDSRLVGTYDLTTPTVIRIERDGTTIHYVVDGERVATSQFTSDAALVGDIVLRDAGQVLTDVGLYTQEAWESMQQQDGQHVEAQQTLASLNESYSAIAEPVATLLERAQELQQRLARAKQDYVLLAQAMPENAADYYAALGEQLLSASTRLQELTVQLSSLQSNLTTIVPYTRFLGVEMDFTHITVDYQTTGSAAAVRVMEGETEVSRVAITTPQSGALYGQALLPLSGALVPERHFAVEILDSSGNIIDTYRIAGDGTPLTGCVDFRVLESGMLQGIEPGMFVTTEGNKVVAHIRNPRDETVVEIIGEGVNQNLLTRRVLQHPGGTDYLEIPLFFSNDMRPHDYTIRFSDGDGRTIRDEVRVKFTKWRDSDNALQMTVTVIDDQEAWIVNGQLLGDYTGLPDPLNAIRIEDAQPSEQLVPHLHIAYDFIRYQFYDEVTEHTSYNLDPDPHYDTEGYGKWRRATGTIIVAALQAAADMVHTGIGRETALQQLFTRYKEVADGYRYTNRHLWPEDARVITARQANDLSPLLSEALTFYLSSEGQSIIRHFKEMEAREYKRLTTTYIPARNTDTQAEPSDTDTEVQSQQHSETVQPMSTYEIYRTVRLAAKTGETTEQLNLALKASHYNGGPIIVDDIVYIPNKTRTQLKPAVDSVDLGEIGTSSSLDEAIDDMTAGDESDLDRVLTQLGEEGVVAGDGDLSFGNDGPLFNYSIADGLTLDQAKEILGNSNIIVVVDGDTLYIFKEETLRAVANSSVEETVGSGALLSIQERRRIEIATMADTAKSAGLTLEEAIEQSEISLELGPVEFMGRTYTWPTSNPSDFTFIPFETRMRQEYLLYLGRFTKIADLFDFKYIEPMTFEEYVEKKRKDQLNSTSMNPQSVPGWTAMSAAEKETVRKALTFSYPNQTNQQLIEWTVQKFIMGQEKDMHWDGTRWIGTAYDPSDGPEGLGGECKWWADDVVAHGAFGDAGDLPSLVYDGKKVYKWNEGSTVAEVALSHPDNVNSIVDAINSGATGSGDIIQGDKEMGGEFHTMIIGAIQENGIWVFDSNYGWDDIPRYHFISYDSLSKYSLFTIYRLTHQAS